MATGKKLYTIEKLSEILKIDRNSLYSYVRKGFIKPALIVPVSDNPKFKRGKLYYFELEKVIVDIEILAKRKHYASKAKLVNIRKIAEASIKEANKDIVNDIFAERGE